MRPWRASLLHSKQSRSMRPSSARAPRRGRRCSSTSRYFTIGSACTRPWDTEPRPRLAPAWRRSPCARQPDILISPLHTKGGGPPLSQDLRERIVRVVEGGSTTRKAARRFAVSASAAIKLMQRVRQTGSAAPAKIGGYRRPLLEKHADALRAIVSSKAGITLREIKAALAVRGIAVKALSTIADMLHRLDLSHKKRA